MGKHWKETHVYNKSNTAIKVNAEDNEVVSINDGNPGAMNTDEHDNTNIGVNERTLVFKGDGFRSVVLKIWNEQGQSVKFKLDYGQDCLVTNEYISAADGYNETPDKFKLPFAFGDQVKRGDNLIIGQAIMSSEKTHYLTLQEDGNLVVYKIRDEKTKGEATWASSTFIRDSKLTVTDNGWSIYIGTNATVKYSKLTASALQPQSAWVDLNSVVPNLKIQNDGNLVFYGRKEGSSENSELVPLWDTKHNGATVDFQPYFAKSFFTK